MANQTDRLLDKIALPIIELLKAETVVVAEAVDEEALHYAAAVGKHAAVIKGKKGKIATSGLCGTAIESNCPILVTKTAGDTRIRQDYVRSLGIYTALAVPLQYEGKLLGAIMVLNRIDGSLFDEKAEKILADYASKVCPSLYESKIKQ